MPKPLKKRQRSAFGDDSDEDGHVDVAPVDFKKMALMAHAEEEERAIAEVLSQDSDAYKYDEVYEEIQEQREHQLLSRAAKKKHERVN